MNSATTMSSVTRMEFTVLNGRMSHICAIIGSSMFMFGGYHKSETDARLKDRDVTVNMADINIYSTTDATWRKVVATGDVPNPGSGMCMASHRRFIYAFGGLTVNQAQMREFSNNLHELDTETFVWRLLEPARDCKKVAGVRDRPSIRDKAAMVYFDNALWVFAGWGTRIDRTQNNSTFVPDTSHDFVGWNNELWKFDLDQMSWSSPQCSGSVPSPRAAHTLTMCSDNRAVLFGGRTREGRVSELYILDFSTLTWEGPVSGGEGPEPRSLHTCTRLHDGNVLLLGGMNSNGDSVKAQWILKSSPKLGWERVKLCEEARCARTWHTTAARAVSASCTELLVFGGSPDNIWQPKHKYWAHMTRFFYGVKPLYEICLDHMSQSKTGQMPQNTDITSEIKDRRKVLKATNSTDPDSTIMVLDMERISPTSAS